MWGTVLKYVSYVAIAGLFLWVLNHNAVENGKKTQSLIDAQNRANAIAMQQREDEKRIAADNQRTLERIAQNNANAASIRDVRVRLEQIQQVVNTETNPFAYDTALNDFFAKQTACTQRLMNGETDATCP